MVYERNAHPPRGKIRLFFAFPLFFALAEQFRMRSSGRWELQFAEKQKTRYS
jgi:hypothetical protein